MDKTTFGNFQAAIDLVDIVQKHPLISRKVSSLINDYTTGLKQIRSVPDRQYKVELALMWRNKYLGEINFDADEINSFVKNVIVTYYRKFLEYPNIEEVDCPRDLTNWVNSDRDIIWYLYDVNLLPEQIRTIKQVCTLRGFQFGWKCHILASKNKKKPSFFRSTWMKLTARNDSEQRNA